MPDLLPGLPKTFKDRLAGYLAQICDAIRRNAHHDHCRALLIEFVRTTFGIEIDEIEPELKVSAAEARGRIDAFYKYVIFEVNVPQLQRSVLLQANIGANLVDVKKACSCGKKDVQLMADVIQTPTAIREFQAIAC